MMTTNRGKTTVSGESLSSGGASNKMEEKAMPDPTNKNKVFDPIKHELENTSMSRPHWARDHRFEHISNGDSDSEAISESFLDAILEVIAQSIERVLAEVMTRCVADGIERKIRPLSQEIARMRIALEDGSDTKRRREGGCNSHSNR
jgi:hypothetical protein